MALMSISSQQYGYLGSAVRPTDCLDQVLDFNLDPMDMLPFVGMVL